MKFHCAVCGLAIRGRVVMPFNCSCGFRQFANPPGLSDRIAATLARRGITTQAHDTTSADSLAKPESEPLSWREEICETCPQYMGNQRCRLLGLGCTKHFKTALRKNKCPRKKWERKPVSKIKWSCGFTTVPQRIDDGIAKRTLDSIDAAGFPKPRIFVDGVLNKRPRWLDAYKVVERGDNLRTFGNWILTAWEVYLREPNGGFFAVFQDDFVAVQGLREYLEKIKYPDRGYLNLYTFPKNVKPQQGFYPSNQKGLGAVAIVFNNEAIRTILSSTHMIGRPMNDRRGWRNVDGGIVTGFRKLDWKEYVHNPSLVQHTGKKSSMGNREHELADTFPGEDFDARTLLVKPEVKVHEPLPRRVGIVGYNTASGLGELNRQLATYCKPDAWLLRGNNRHVELPYDYPETKAYTNVEDFLNSVDVVVFPETPFFASLVEKAKKLGKRVVCIPMLEWMPVNGWISKVDLYVCPTSHSYETLKGDGLPCSLFPWPFDTSRFTFRQREKCTRFLFINGHGGWRGRKGASIIKQAKELWPEMPLLVRSQKSEQWPAGTEVLPPVKDNNQLYMHGDVLLAPHRVDGIGLELLEALSSGMPVIATDGHPWNEQPLLDKINARVTKQKVRRNVDWYQASPEHLVEVCKRWLGKDISEQSKAAREYAIERRWQGRVEEFIELVRTGRHRVTLPFKPAGAI